MHNNFFLLEFSVYIFAAYSDVQCPVRHKVLPKIKQALYANSITDVPVSPIDGVYAISTVPTMKPPPTHVARIDEHKANHI